MGKRAGSAHVNLGTSAGYMTTSFGPATDTGNVLTMTATSTGQLGQYGKLYQFRSTQKNRHQAIISHHKQVKQLLKSVCDIFQSVIVFHRVRQHPYSPEPAIPTILNQ